MTKQEAIARIKDHMTVHKMNEPRAIYISEALDMAIKALEQQPCEDTISRQETLNKINELIADHIPSVTSQPKTGHWEYVQYDYNPNIGNWHCSECRSIIIECAHEIIPAYRYCPNCGATMEVQHDKGRSN